MALDYDTAIGFKPASAHQNVRKTWDTLLHEQVLSISQWNGLIGQDKGGEGSLEDNPTNKPIVSKTQLGKEAGDQITMGLVKSNVTPATWYNDGVTGNSQLVDNEGSLTLYNVKVKVGHQRFGILIDGKMTNQRTPYNLMSTAKNNIAQSMAYTLDSSPFFTLYSGYSQNIFREYGTTAVVPVEHPNQIYGKGKAALTDVTTADVLDTDMLEIIRVFVQTANLNRAQDGKVLLFAHPLNIKTLRADSAWIDANAFAQPRGDSNPIFRDMDGLWADIVVKQTNKIDGAWDAPTTTVSSDVITLGTETVGDGITAANVKMLCLVGGNAVARAFALESYMARRKEDDYENKYGFAGGCIYGDRRADFALSQDSGSDGGLKNQSSAIVYAHAPSVTVPSVW